MSEKLKYVTPEYQAQLDALAETLITPRRYGQLALSTTVEPQMQFDLAPTEAE